MKNFGLTPLQIAMVCHETNRAYCVAIGDNTQKSWDEAEQWQKISALNGVNFAIANPNLSPTDQHNAWSNDKLKDGWVYGEIKDVEKKTHPCLVPYDELPVEQQFKDKLFRAVVISLMRL